MHLLRLPGLFGIALTTLFATTLMGQTLATGDTRHVREPHYPQICAVLPAQFSASDRATPPASDDTARLQTALNDCANTGKAVFLTRTFTGDAFYAGALTIKGEALVVGRDTTLFGNNYGSKQFLSVSGTNAAIMGPGSIDGRGDIVGGGARLINAEKLSNFTVYDVTLMHAAKMHLYIEEATGVTVWRLHVRTPANTKNTDGIDLDSVSDATVFDSVLEDGDDGVAIKTNSGPAANITVKNNRFYGTHGMSIGSQTMYGVTNVLWENNQMFGTDEWGNVSTDNNGIRMKSDETCGGEVKQVTYRNTRLDGIKHLLIFNTYYGTCSGHAGIPWYHDIVVDHLMAVNSQSGAYSQFQGYNAGYPLGLYLAFVHLDVTNQTGSQYANVGLENSNITPAGTGVTTFDFRLHRDDR
jgi:polygalacturonase